MMKRKTPWVKNCPRCGRFSSGGKPCKDGRCKPMIIKTLKHVHGQITHYIDPLYVKSLNKKSDPDIRQQKHYNQFKIQPITFIVENKLTFCQGNAIKYLLRHSEKNGVEDLEKAKVYIDYMIEEIKTGTVKP
jgi:hypothetical protein